MYNERLNINTSIRQTSVNVSPQITQTSLSFSPAIDSSLTTWGSITGILENQTDLWEVLSGKISLTSLSSTAIGLNYDNTTGIFSLESGYEIPLSSTLATFITKDVDDLTYYTKTEDLPPVNDGTLAIRQNGIDVGYFSANQSENSYIDIQTPTKTSNLTNDGNGVSPFATEYYVNTNAGKIDKIQKNGVDLPIVNKIVNISVPTKTSDLTNNSNFVSDANYVHTDNNFTNSDLDKLNSIEASAQVNDVNSVNGKTGYVELTTSDIPNTSGYINKDVYNLTYYMPTATINSKLEQKQDKINDLSNIRQGAGLGATALQPNDNITQLTNNAGYITNSALIPLQNDITTINSKIPSQATSSNQLADKSFVNSSIATNTANFIGTFNSVAELEAYSGTVTNNDYAFVKGTDSAGNTVYDRYKYNADEQEWLFEYELNNSSFTADQWASINSGITSGDVALISSALQPNDDISKLNNDVGYTSNIGTVTSVNNISPVNGNVSLTIPTINSTNNYVPYRSGASTLANSSLMYNSSAMAFTGRLHVGSSSPGSYYDKGKFTIYDNTPSQQVTSMALLNYGGGGGCGVAIDMYNTSANGGIPSGRFGVVDNGNYSGYLQLQVKKSGSQSNPLLPAMNIVPVPASNSLTTCVSFGQDEFNRVLFDLHKPEATVTITDSDKRWGGSGTTYSVTGSNKFNPRLLVAVGDIISFDNFTTEATVTGVVSNSSTLQITVNQTLGTISNKNISVKKAYFKITDENDNTKVYVDPYGRLGVGTGTPAYDLDVAGTINASTDIKINGSSVATVAKTGNYNDLINKPSIPSITFYWGE